MIESVPIDGNLPVGQVGKMTGMLEKYGLDIADFKVDANQGKAFMVISDDSIRSFKQREMKKDRDRVRNNLIDDVTKEFGLDLSFKEKVKDKFKDFTFLEKVLTTAVVGVGVSFVIGIGYLISLFGNAVIATTVMALTTLVVLLTVLDVTKY